MVVSHKVSKDLRSMPFVSFSEIISMSLACGCLVCPPGFRSSPFIYWPFNSQIFGTFGVEWIFGLSWLAPRRQSQIKIQPLRKKPERIISAIRFCVYLRLLAWFLAFCCFFVSRFLRGHVASIPPPPCPMVPGHFS